MFEFEYTLNDEDRFQFHKYLRRTLRINLIWILPSVILFVLVFVSLLLRLSNVGYVLLLIGVFWFLYFPLHYNGKNYGILPYDSSVKMDFSDNEICGVTEVFDIKTGYSEIKRIKVCKNSVYIFISITSAYIIPKRAFSGQDEQTKFFEFIRSK